MASPLLEIRRQLQDLELQSAVTKTDFYREYTQFLIRRMSDISIIDAEGKPVDSIPSFYANPERAVAKIHEDRNLVLPVISIGISDIGDDPDRRRTNMNIVFETTWDEAKQRAQRVVSVAPKAVKLSFVISIWAKYMEDLNQIVETIQLMFNPSLDFRTEFSDYIQGFITQVTDNSTMVVGDRQDRIVRRSIQVTVDAYVPNQKFLYTSTGRLEAMKALITISGDNSTNHTSIKQGLGDS